jgi:hypothetical protein
VQQDPHNHLHQDPQTRLKGLLTRISIIDQSVAIVIKAIANLRPARMDQGIGVIAIKAQGMKVPEWRNQIRVGCIGGCISIAVTI